MWVNQPIVEGGGDHADVDHEEEINEPILVDVDEDEEYRPRVYSQ